MQMERIVGVALLGLTIGLASASAQTFPFQISSVQGTTTTNISNGGVINLTSTTLGQPTSARITVMYIGNNRAILSTAPQVFGSSAFTLTPDSTFPATLERGESVTFTATFIAFPPVSPTPATAQITLPYVETTAPTNTAGVIGLSLFGTASELTVNYILQSEGNVFPLAPGASLVFPDLNVNAATDATIVIANRGSGQGRVDDISITGEGFQILGRPLLPAFIAASSDLRFTVRFNPKEARAYTGALQLSLGGNSFTAILQGKGVRSSYSYELILPTGTVPIAPGQPIALPDTKLGERSTVDLRMRNTGTAPGTVELPIISGDGFDVIDAPRFPVLVNPNDSILMTLGFTPTAPGKVTGRFRIASDLFDLTATGLGARFIVSYVVAGSPVDVGAGGVVVLSPQTIGKSSLVEMTVANTGTLAASIAAIGVVDSDNVFQVQGLPPLPANLGPGQSLKFNVAFTPVATGLATANLLINSTLFVLSGIGTAPPPLPAYRFTGPQGAVEPFQQPAVSLSLVSEYPVALKGTLTLTQDSGALSSDPAVQFSSSGQKVDFTIPAGSLNAVFPNGTTQVRFQTGSVASAITLRPTFSTSAGMDLTPASPTTLQVSVPRSAPRLLTAAVTSRSSVGFTLSIAGYTTSRSLSSLTFQFTTTSDVTLSESRFTLDVAGSSTVWFQNPSSQAFGGQFTVSIPVSLRVSSGSVPVPIDKFVSVAVTAANESGSSNSITAAIQ